MGGLKFDGKLRTRAVIYQNILNPDSHNLSRLAAVFQAEMFGIEQTARALIGKKLQIKIHVLTNNQASLKTVPSMSKM
jgi:hypothetical protein